MEDITLTRLQNDFDEVIKQINDIVERKDIDAARKALEQIRELVANEEHVPLDDQEGYDHILHRLLANISGVIEIAGTRGQNPELDILIEERERIDKELREIEEELKGLGEDGTVTVERLSIEEVNLTIIEIRKFISRRRGVLKNPRIKEETRARIEAEIQELEAYLVQLEGYVNGRGEEEPVDTSEIDAEIANKEKEIADLEARIAALGDNPDNPEEPNKNQEEIDRLNAEIAELEEQMRQAARARQAAREVGNDSEEAIANAEYARIVEEISSRRSRIEELSKDPRQEEIDRLSAEVAELEEQMRQAARARQAAREAGNDSEEAIANSEYARIVEEISNRNRRIEELRANPNQDRIDEINRRIAELESEIEGLNGELERLQGIMDRFPAVEEPEPVVVFEGVIGQGMPTPEEQFERETGTQFDPERYEIVWDGADGEQYTDEPATPFRIVDKQGNQDRPAPVDPEIELMTGVIGQGMPTPEEQFERETGIPFDPAIHEIVWDGADGEEYTDEPATPFRVVVKRSKVQARIDQIKKEIEEKNEEVNKLKEERDRLEQGKGGKGGKGTPGNSERKKLEEELEKKKKELEDLKNKRAQMLGGKTNQKDTEMLILMIKARIRLLEIKRETAKRNRNKVDEDKITAEIEVLQIRLTKIEKSVTTKTTDNSARRKELLARKEELEKRRKEIDIKIEEISGTKGIPSDRLDLGEEARKIGDHIFKTARIREELTSRGYTREDFLSFYEQGRERTRQALERIKANRDQIIESYAVIVGDESGTDLDTQLRNATEDAQKIAILEKLRQRFVAAGLGEELEKNGLNDPITTMEAAQKFEAFFGSYKDQIKRGLEGLSAELSEHALNLKVFDREIRRIKDEMETIKVAGGDLSGMEAKAAAEKELRERQIRATIHGDEKLEKEWDERIRRFVGHRAKAKHTYVGSDGQQHEIEYDTIEDYEQYGDDAYFLNLEEYKRYLENVSKYEASNGDPNALDLSGHEFDEYHRLMKEDPAKASAWLSELMSQQKDYVTSFHGFTNEHAVRYATLRTAGSTLEGMLPVRGELPTTTKLKNAATNTARFLMLRWPKFTRTDSTGKTVPNILGGLGTLVMDGLVIGGAAAAVVASGPAGLIPFGVFYGAKGIVTLGNVIAGRREYSRYQNEIDSNLPTLGHASARDKEIARRNHYQEVDHYSRPRAWFRAKWDKYFSRKRARRTEESIIERAKARVNATIDERNGAAVQNAKENLETAERNQRTRVERTQAELRSAGVYNDMVRDPDSVDQEQAAAIAAQNAAVKSENPDYVGADVNPTSQEPRGDKYVKEKAQYGKTEDLKSVETEGGTASVAGITVDQKYRAKMERQDAINRVLTWVIATAANVAIAHIQGRLTQEKTEQVQDPDKTETFTDKRAVNRTETTEVDDYGTTQVTQADNGTSISDLKYSDENFQDTYGAVTRGASTSGGKGGRAIDSIAVRTKGPNGREVEWSIAERGTGIKPGYHVHGGVDVDISDMPLSKVLEQAAQADPSGFQQYCQATGLTGKSFDEIATYILEHKDLWGQTKNMEGWSQVISGGLKSIMKKIKIGSHTESHEVFDHYEYFENTRVVPGQVRDITVKTFSPIELGKRALDGAAIGAVGTGIDTLHELARPTDKTLRGNDEEVNPDRVMSRVALEAQKRFDEMHRSAGAKREGKKPNTPEDKDKDHKKDKEPEDAR